MTELTNVNVSMNAIDAQRAKLQEKENYSNYKKFEFDEKNYLNVKLAPNETTRSIRVRLLPVSSTESTPFLILKAHSLKVDTAIARSGFKSYLCLNDEHLDKHDERGCPLCNRSKELLAKSNATTDQAERKALFKAAMQYKAKDTFVVRVIERGHEDEGVKFWRFNAHNDGTGVYDKLMSIYDERQRESIEAGDEVPYNVFDLQNGKDFTITLTKTIAADGKTEKTTINIVDAGRETPLSKDVEQALAWINDPKTFKDLYASKTYDYIDIVADGGVPVFNRDKGVYVKREDQIAADEQLVAEAQKELEMVNTTIAVENTVVNTETVDDELPF